MFRNLANPAEDGKSHSLAYYMWRTIAKVSVVAFILFAVYLRLAFGADDYSGLFRKFFPMLLVLAIGVFWTRRR